MRKLIVVFGGTGVLGKEMQNDRSLTGVHNFDTPEIVQAVTKAVSFSGSERLSVLYLCPDAKYLHDELAWPFVCGNYPVCFFGRNTVDLVAPDAEERLLRLFECLQPSCVVYVAGYTKVLRSSEKDSLAPYEVNTYGVYNAARAAQASDSVESFVYISTDYCYGGAVGNYKEPTLPLRLKALPEEPVNYYAWSKLQGERHCSNLAAHKRVLIIRTSFFPKWKKWPYEKAFIDQFTSRRRVDEIAPDIVAAIRHFALNDVPSTYLNIGGAVPYSVYDLARMYYPEQDIKAGLRREVSADSPDDLPADTTMDTTFWRKQWMSHLF